jgi:Ca2+-binding EF-hand superfamily protein
LQIGTIQYRKLDFEEFCAAAISVHQLEGMESWEQHARLAYELFEKDGNRPIMIEELASVLSLSLSHAFSSREMLHDSFFYTP